MTKPINPKYPLFLRDFGKNKANNEGNNIVGGYPIVTVEDNFNIEAKPNTFYNIKNNAGSEVSINFKDGYSIEGSNKLLFINAVLEGEDDFMEAADILMLSGLSNLIDDSTKEGYKYKSTVSFSVEDMTINIVAYFSDEIKNGNNVNCLFVINGLSNVTGSLNNIQILNENNDYVAYIMHSQVGRLPHIVTEIENDSDVFSHKYTIYGALMNMVEYVYTKEPYTLATDFYLDEDTTISDMGATVEILSNVSLPPSDIANEFVFNINAPANITFSDVIKWHNGNIPDLTQSGVYTISILDGVGCYTFVQN